MTTPLKSSSPNPRGLLLLVLVAAGTLVVILRQSSSSVMTASRYDITMPNFDFDSSTTITHLDEAQTDEEEDALLAFAASASSTDSEDLLVDGEGAASEGDDDLAEDGQDDDTAITEPINLRIFHHLPSQTPPLVHPLPSPFLPFTCSSCIAPPSFSFSHQHPLPVCAKYSGGVHAPNNTYDKHLLDRSVVFEGTGQEVRRVLRRSVKSLLYGAKRTKDGTGNDADLYEDEESFRILVLGGSVSNCRGVSSAACWHSRVEDWFHRAMPLEGDPKPRGPLFTIIDGPSRQAASDDSYLSDVQDKRAVDLMSSKSPTPSSPSKLKRRSSHELSRKKKKTDHKKKKKGKSKVLEPKTQSGRKRPVTRVINAAKSATGSAFYAHCFEAEMAARGKSQTWGKGPDLVILEFGVNDVWPTTEAATKDFEKLLFYLRSLPSNPAIIILEAASLLLAQSSSTITNAEYLHLPAAHFHDVPVLSTKHTLFGPATAILPASGLKMQDLFLPDLHHFNERGHELLADVLVSYLEKQACRVQREVLEDAGERVAKTRGEALIVEPELDVGKRSQEMPLALPERSLFTPYDADATLGLFKVPPPTCLQVGNSKSKVVPSKNHGWTKYSWARDKQYLTADKPGSSVTFDIDVGAGGEVLIDWLRSRFYDLGNVLIYLDKKKSKGVVVAGYWDLGWSIGVPTAVFSGVPPGPHSLTIELLPASQSSHPNQKTVFRLIGIITS